MTTREWLDVARRIGANWPHQRLPDASLAKFYDDLRHLEVGRVLAAVETLYRDGRPYPPNGAQILGRVAVLEADNPEFGEAWRLVVRAAGKFGSYGHDEAMAWLEERHGLVAELARVTGWRELCMSLEGDTTFQAQARRRWDAIVARDARATTWAGVPGLALRRVDGRELAA